MNKVADLRSVRDPNTGVFLGILWNFYKHLFVTEHLLWLLLHYTKNLVLETRKPCALYKKIFALFERIIYKELMYYVENLLSDYITGFRKLHRRQHCHLKMLQNWKNALDKNKSVCASWIFQSWNTFQKFKYFKSGFACSQK